MKKKRGEDRHTSESIASSKSKSQTTIHGSSSEKPAIYKIVIICAVILVLFFVVFQFSSSKNAKYRTVYYNATVAKNVTEMLPETLTFDQYMRITDSSYSKGAVINGYLKKEIRYTDNGGKITNYYLMDEYSNKIALLFGYYVSDRYYDLFVDDAKSTDAFTVTGVLKKTVDGLNLDVEKIEPYNKTVSEVTHEILVIQTLSKKEIIN